MTGQEAGLAGQLTALPKCYWTLRFGLGFDGATPEGFIEVDADLKTMAGEGMARQRASICGSSRPVRT
jgi:L-fuculose-phosphate aldolase